MEVKYLNFKVKIIFSFTSFYVKSLTIKNKKAPPETQRGLI